MNQNKDKTCGVCAHFIGMGDWNLCCTQPHEGYPFGFLCYEDTPACDKFKMDDVQHNKQNNYFVNNNEHYNTK